MRCDGLKTSVRRVKESTPRWQRRRFVFPRTAVCRGGSEPLMSVESECGAVALGRPYLLPPLSSGGASLGRPWLPFPHPAHRTGHADFPHPALGQDFTLLF